MNVKIESLIRRVVNGGKVETGNVTATGLTTEVPHTRRIHHPFSWIDELVTEYVNEPAIEITLPDGSTKTLILGQSEPPVLGSRVEFGKIIALWSVVNEQK